jgi:hypothetical protein
MPSIEGMAGALNVGMENLPMKTSRYTYKKLEQDVAELNKQLEAHGAALRMDVGSRNGYTAIDLATPEQLSRYCCQRMLIGGTPKECIAEANAYVLTQIKRPA